MNKFIMTCLQKFPDSYWYSGAERKSFQEISLIVDSIGRQLAEKLRKGSKCLILCDEQENVAIAILGCWMAGMIPIPLYKNHGSQFYSKISAFVEPDVLICDTPTTLEQPLCVFNILTKTFSGELSTTPIEDELSDVVLILCTSGTTGHPKAVMLQASAILSNVLDIADYMVLDQTDVVLIARPLMHSAVITGEFLAALYSGCNIRFLDGCYNPQKISSELCNGATVLGGTPTLYKHISLLLKGRTCTYTLRTIILSGEILPDQTAKLIMDTFPEARIFNVYGLTEASPRISYLPPGKFTQWHNTVGIPLNSVKLKIVGRCNQILKPMERGHLWVTGPNLMKGYYRDTYSTSKVLVDGWLDTKDIAYINKHGFLVIEARADDMIIKAGMNIYPKEIELVLAEQDHIQDAAAYKLNSADGQGIGLYVVVDNTHISKKDVMRICCSCLPRYELPDKIDILPELPHNMNGKLIRKPHCKLASTEDL